MTPFGRKLTRVMLTGAGLVMFLLGLFGALFGLVAIFDPVGTQMANDASPDGEPRSLAESIAIVGLYSALAILGAWLFKRAQRVFPDVS